jgi:hypothetical protein
MGWKFYYPDDEEPSDARAVKNCDIGDDAYWVAKAACEQDYSEYDGWERVGSPFNVTLITPEGNDIAYIFEHEPDINHAVREA